MNELNNNQETPANGVTISQPYATASGGAGGIGGQATTIAYTNNYSSLLLVYTFLLNLANGSGLNNSNEMKSEVNLLLPMLQEAMEEEKKIREAFLSAVQSLVKE